MIDGQKRGFMQFQDVRAFLDSILDEDIHTSITVAGPLLIEETPLILYVLRTRPVRIRFRKRRELPI